MSAISPAAGAHHRLAPLDGLRGLGFLMVLATHVVSSLGLPPIGLGGVIGVQIFFVLSGYLLTGPLWRGRTDRQAYRRFVARRVQRLYPALLGLAIVVPLAFAATGSREFHESVRGAAAALSQTTAFVYDAVPVEWRPTWSLTVEWTFYLVWPVVVLVARRHGADVATMLRVTLVLAGGLFGLGLLLPDAKAYLWPVNNLAVLLVGAAVALREADLARSGRRLAMDQGYGLIALGALVVIAMLPLSTLGWGYRLFTQPAVAALAAVVLVAAHQGGGPVARFLGTRPLRQVGLRAYSCYLWHLPVLWLAWSLLPGRSTGAVAAAAVVGGVIVVEVSYRLLEVPVLGLRRAAPSAVRPEAVAG